MKTYPEKMNEEQMAAITKAINDLHRIQVTGGHLADKGMSIGLVIYNLKKLETDVFDYHYSKGKYENKKEINN